jgi:AraC family transcriptional regulator
MAQDKPLALDLTKDNASLQIIPYAPLISSSKVGWNGIQLKHYHRLPPHEMPEYFPAQHVIVTHSDRPSFQVERKLDGHLHRDRMIAGDIVVVPANISHGAYWNTEINITVLILEPTFVAHTIYESVDPDRIELIPHFSKSDPLISQIAFALKTELESDGLSSRLYAESMATALSAHLLRHYSAGKHAIQDYTGGLSKYKLRQSLEYIHDNLIEGFSLQAIANYIGMSQYHFARMFKQSTGMTPHQYLIESRLEKAKKLLANTDLTISEIAYRTGFASQSHLTSQFRKHVTITPKAYRKML